VRVVDIQLRLGLVAGGAGRGAGAAGEDSREVDRWEAKIRIEQRRCGIEIVGVLDQRDAIGRRSAAVARIYQRSFVVKFFDVKGAEGGLSAKRDARIG
jgi:hypothetical protein